MKLRFVCLGRTRSSEVRALIDHYCERIQHFHPLEVIEKKSTHAGPDVLEELRGKKAGVRVALLAEEGRAFTSEEFARWLGREIDSGAGQLVFLLGGAEGFPAESKAQADALISLSRMTYPHELARAMLAEQIYRAFTILRQHPYSK